MEGGKLITIQIDWGLFLLTGLVIYRMSYLFTREEGPFGLIAWARGHVNPSQSNWIGRGVNCPLCISFWLSLVAAIMIFPQSILFTWLSLAGLSALFERIST